MFPSPCETFPALSWLLKADCETSISEKQCRRGHGRLSFPRQRGGAGHRMRFGHQPHTRFREASAPGSIRLGGTPACRGYFPRWRSEQRTGRRCVSGPDCEVRGTAWSPAVGRGCEALFARLIRARAGPGFPAPTWPPFLCHAALAQMLRNGKWLKLSHFLRRINDLEAKNWLT